MDFATKILIFEAGSLSSLVLVIFIEILGFPILKFIGVLIASIALIPSRIKSIWTEMHERRYRKRVADAINKTWPKDWTSNCEFMGIEVPERYKTL